MPFKCDRYPAVVALRNKCLVMQDNKYWYFNFYCQLAWEMERQLWIAFHKNDQNDKCYLNLVSRDVLMKIIFFFLDPVFE